MAVQPRLRYGAPTLSDRRSLPVSWLGFALLATSCAGGAGGSDAIVRVDDVGAGLGWASLWPELAEPTVREAPLPEGAFPARQPSRAQLEALRTAERQWRAKDDAAFVRARDLAATDPVHAFWFARLLVRDLLIATDTASDAPSALVAEVPWRRPFQALADMGTAAVPCVVLDLLRSSQADRRDIGARLLAAMGLAALPTWRGVLAVDDARGRRAATRALGLLPVDPGVGAQCVALLADGDLGVRAEALRALGRQGEAGGIALRERLTTETDPFLRQAIADGLGHQADHASAAALVEMLRQALELRDNDQIAAARSALMRRSGRREPGSLRSWEQWLAELPKT